MNMKFLLGLPARQRLSVLAYHRVLAERDPLLAEEPVGIARLTRLSGGIPQPA